MSTVIGREQFADLLLKEIERLQEARQLPPGDARFDTVELFMDGVLSVGRALTADPGLREEADVQLFLRESGHVLAYLHPSVDFYRAMTAHQAYGVWEGGIEWERLLRRRSSLQFLENLYSGTEYDGFFELLELDDLDSLIRERGRSEGFPDSFQVPGDIPTTHWWWWWPRQPPAR